MTFCPLFSLILVGPSISTSIPAGTSTISSNFFSIKIHLINKCNQSSPNCRFLCFPVRHYPFRRRHYEHSHILCRQIPLLVFFKLVFPYCIPWLYYPAIVDFSCKSDFEHPFHAIVDKLICANILIFLHNPEQFPKKL